MQTKTHKLSAGGVVVHDNKVLSIKWLSKNSISFPKGTVDDGESVQQTALREVKEETGYDVTILDELGDITYEFDWIDGNHYEKTVTFFLMKLANDDAPQTNLQPGEDFENIWLSVDETMNQLTFDHSRDILLRALNSPKFPFADK
ncbi:MAG: NUDIX domain-containing protein [Patescibacteria group bacterium]